MEKKGVAIVLTRKCSRMILGTGLVLMLVALAACAAPPTPVPTQAPAVATTAPAKPPAPTTAPTNPPAPTTAPTVPPAPTATRAPQVLRLAGRRFSSTIDPSVTVGAGYEWLTNIFEGLTRIDPTNGKVIPAAAEKWQASADGKQYTFTIRKGLKWSDGSPLTAKDFEWGWKRTLDPKTGSRFAYVMYFIKGAEAYNTGKGDADSVGVKALDDNTLQVTLGDSSPFFPMMVSMVTYYPLPRAAIEKFGDKWVDPANIVSNGPYKFESWKPDQQAVLVRNPNYWGPPTGVDKAIWTIFEDQMQQGLTAYENNEVDISPVGAQDLDRVRKDAKLGKELRTDSGSGVTVLAIDTSSKPFDNPQVRQALYLGIDRDKLANAVYKGAVLPALTLVPPGIDGNNPAAALKGGIADAKTLLASAGFPDGKGFPEVQYYTGGDADSKLLGEFIQNQWLTNLGIKTKLNPLEGKAFSDWRRATRKDRKPYNGVVVRGWTSDYLDPTDWYNSILASKADYWDTRWKNATFDALVDKAASDMDLAQRKKMYEDAEVIVMQDMPIIPLDFDAYYTVVKPNVQGVYIRPESIGIAIPLQYVNVK